VNIPLVSVVIPFYQQSAYIQRALQSVLRQTLASLEVIVVDDGSTDDAINTLTRVPDPRLVVYRQQHLGVSAARNRGVALSHAPWVGFLDADDEWPPDFLESMMQIAGEVGGLSAIFSNLHDHQSGRPLLSRVARDGPLVRDYFATVLENNGQGMSSSSVLVSRSSLVACGGFPEGVNQGEDIDLWARLAWSGDVAFCGRTSAVYHTEVPSSASKNAHQTMVPYPAVLRSFEAWSAGGRIQLRLLRSTRRYANWLLARHVMELSHQGFGEEARRRLRQASWRGRSDRYLLRALIWTWIPTGILRMGRKARAAMRRESSPS
jgi:glycosyltransferase involved in cell wall biosynthesis